jgi:hypothetical protein
MQIGLGPLDFLQSYREGGSLRGNEQLSQRSDGWCQIKIITIAE